MATTLGWASNSLNRSKQRSSPCCIVRMDAHGSGDVRPGFARRMAASRSGGPEPIARSCSTPASSARWTTSGRSASKRGSSRWQCESTQHHLRARADRDVFEKASQHRLAALDRGGHDHAIGEHAAHLARFEIGHDHHLAADQLLGPVGFGDAGYERAWLGLSDLHFQFQQLSGALDRLRSSTSPTRISTLAKSSIEILDAGSGAGQARRRARVRRQKPAAGAGALPTSAACRAASCSSSARISGMAIFGSMRGNTGVDSGDPLPRLELSPGQILEAHGIDRPIIPNSHQILAVASGSTGASRTVAMRSTSRPCRASRRAARANRAAWRAPGRLFDR